MPAPATQIFQRLAAGDVREAILVAFRNSLRELPDPKTDAPFSEDVIRQATMQGSRFWVEAEAIDLLNMGFQRRAEFIATQVDPRRASGAFLEHFHGPAAKLPRLEATGGGGQVAAGATPGTVFIGSTTVPDALATQATDEAGLRYQVFANATTPVAGTVVLALQAIDTGRATNLPSGTKLTWINPPGGAAPTCIAGAFKGGTPRETDQEWGERLFDARGSRPASGNAAHFRLWAKRASNAVGEAYVYPCGLNAGSVVVAILGKRAGVLGNIARVPTAGVMSIVRGALTPPSSSVVPGRVHVVVTAAGFEECDVAVALSMRRGSVAGWQDSSPWPRFESGPATIQSVPEPSGLTFRMTAPTAPPLLNPQLMVWLPELSAFEHLEVVSVVPEDPGSYLVTLLREPPLSGAPSLAWSGRVVSPYSARHASISAALEAYFDSLGPGEIVNLETDMRAARAYRRPSPDVSAPYQIDASFLGFLSDALGAPVGAGILSASPQAPSIPTTASQGPRFLVPRNFAVYPA